jgi:type I restriction enzyme S subunit
MAIEFHRDGPWELPEGWVWTRLGQLGSWTGGGTPSKSNKAFWTDGNVPWISPKDMKTDIVGDSEDRITEAAVANSSTKLVPPYSVLMVVRSGILNHTFPVAVCDREVTLNQDMRALIPFDGIDARYACFVIRRLQRHILEECSKDGTTVASVEPSRLENVWIPLAPTSEQSRIVARIDELFAEIADGEASLDRARDDLDTWRSALLKAAVTGELTREWREANRLNTTGRDMVDSAAEMKARFGVRLNRNRHTRNEDDGDLENLPKIPPGWAWAKLSDFAHASSYGTSVKCSYDGSGIAVLRIPNIRAGRIDLANMKYATVPLDIEDDELVDIGDLLIVRTNGSEDLIGRGAIVVEPLDGRVYFASYLIRFRIVSNTPLRRWLALHLESPVARAWIRKNIASSAGQYNISQTALMRMPVPVPSESEMIASLRIFQQVEATREDVATDAHKAHHALPEVRHSILKAAFEGRLVGQDPRDEPADLLLARICERTDTEMSIQLRRTIKKRRAALAAE